MIAENNILIYSKHWPSKQTTEKQALDKVRDLLPNHPAITYLAFPWTALISAFQDLYFISRQLR